MDLESRPSKSERWSSLELQWHLCQTWSLRSGALDLP